MRSAGEIMSVVSVLLMMLVADASYSRPHGNEARVRETLTMLPALMTLVMRLHR